MDVLDGQLATMAAGDVFVLKADQPLSREQADFVRAMAQAALPAGVAVLVLDKGLDFAIVRPPQADDWHLWENPEGDLIVNMPPAEIPATGGPMPSTIVAVPELSRNAALMIVDDHNAAMRAARASIGLVSAELRNTRESFNNAIAYALNAIPDPGAARGFLDLWTHGEFDTIARTYPDFVFGTERL